MSQRRRTAIFVLLFALAVVVVGGRTLANLVVPGELAAPRYGMQDFRDGIYYPAVALLEGHNPYDVADYKARYPVGFHFPLYAPLALLVYLPFALLPQGTAAIVFLFLNLALTLVLAAVLLAAARREPTVAHVLGIGSLIVLSHPGQMALFVGQGAIYLTIGLVLALTCARVGPWLAAAGLALTCLKPTVGVPAAFLLAVRGDRRTLVSGIGIAASLSAAVLPALIIAAGGIRPFLASLADNYGRFGQGPSTMVTETVHRLDAFLLVGRVLGRPLTAAEDCVVVAIVFALASWALRRAVRFEDSVQRPLSSSVIVCAILAGSYHQAYDGLFLSLPVVLATTNSWGRSTTSQRVGRWLVLGAAAVLAMNYLSTHAVIDRLRLTGTAWTVVTSVNALAMLAAFLGCLTAVFGARAPATARAAGAPRGDSTAAA